MKAIKVDFVQDRFGAIWWTAVSIGLAICLGAWGYRLQQKIDLREHAQDQLAELQQSQKQSQIDANKPLNTQQKKLLQIASELDMDLNPVFAVVENVNVAGTLLKTMQLDKISGTLRLEFQLGNPSKASLISQALNAGDENRPWILERIIHRPSSNDVSMTLTSASFQVHESRYESLAIWFVNLRHL